LAALFEANTLVNSKSEGKKPKVEQGKTVGQRRWRV
jgi:hypothetical protein